VRLAGTCLLVPVVEELAFRGFLLRWLVSPEFERIPPRAWTWWAVLLSSLGFGALHSHWILGTLAGLAFALARLRRGRLGDAILAHALANAGIAVAVLGSGAGTSGREPSALHRADGEAGDEAVHEHVVEDGDGNRGQEAGPISEPQKYTSPTPGRWARPR
jgi:hypothetical protein